MKVLYVIGVSLRTPDFALHKEGSKLKWVEYKKLGIDITLSISQNLEVRKPSIKVAQNENFETDMELWGVHCVNTFRCVPSSVVTFQQCEIQVNTSDMNMVIIFKSLRKLMIQHFGLNAMIGLARYIRSNFQHLGEYLLTLS